MRYRVPRIRRAARGGTRGTGERLLFAAALPPLALVLWMPALTTPALAFRVDCRIGTTRAVQSYVDHDRGAGAPARGGGRAEDDIENLHLLAVTGSIVSEFLGDGAD